MDSSGSRRGSASVPAVSQLTGYCCPKGEEFQVLMVAWLSPTDPVEAKSPARIPGFHPDSCSMSAATMAGGRLYSCEIFSMRSRYCGGILCPSNVTFE